MCVLINTFTLALLQDLMKNEETHLEQLLDGMLVSELMDNDDMRRDIIISKAQDQLEWGGFVYYNFMNVFSINNNNKYIFIYDDDAPREKGLYMFERKSLKNRRLKKKSN